jgi:hypothetical protein
MQRDHPGSISWNESYIEERSVRNVRFFSPPSEHGGSLVSYDDPDSILRYVLDQLAGDVAVIYPSEQYFYFRFPLRERFISGNIRFSEVERGEISVGYFDEYSQHDFNVGMYTHGSNGVSVGFDETDGKISLSFQGRTNAFRLDRRAFEQPAFDLLESERHISGLLDESGFFSFNVLAIRQSFVLHSK